jgi:hypothetical protein
MRWSRSGGRLVGLDSNACHGPPCGLANFLFFERDTSRKIGICNACVIAFAEINLRSPIFVNCQQQRKNYRAARPGPPRATHCMTLSI